MIYTLIVFLQATAHELHYVYWLRLSPFLQSRLRKTFPAGYLGITGRTIYEA